MTESLIDHWSNTECRKVLEQLLVEEKIRCCEVWQDSGDFVARLYRFADHKVKRVKTQSEAQAWLDQQWKEYVEGMKPENK